MEKNQRQPTNETLTTINSTQSEGITITSANIGEVFRNAIEILRRSVPDPETLYSRLEVSSIENLERVLGKLVVTKVSDKTFYIPLGIPIHLNKMIPKNEVWAKNYQGKVIGIFKI